EAVRNSGRHARGGDLHRQLALRVAIAANGQAVTVAVSDDGVGLQREAARDARDSADSPDASYPAAQILARGSTRTGLLTHAALLSLVGGSLNTHSQPEIGTTVTARVPRMGDD